MLEYLPHFELFLVHNYNVNFSFTFVFKLKVGRMRTEIGSSRLRN